jgi:hypothetical protein
MLTPVRIANEADGAEFPRGTVCRCSVDDGPALLGQESRPPLAVGSR